MRQGLQRSVGIAVGFAADLAAGDPARHHPVAGFGSVAARIEQVIYRDHRLSGTIYAAALVLGASALGVCAGSALAIAGLTWTVIGGTSLRRTASAIADRIEAGDVDGARELIPWLCGRDPQSLDADGIVRAALESVAENTSDATVAPLLWGAVAGGAGLAGYRAANTLDAMVGYRNARYERFGWAAARIDDVLNYVPARVSGLLIVACAPLVGGSSREAIMAWRRDSSAHPSPNAGVVESTMAGALGVQLGGETVYAHGVELRPYLGRGSVPEVGDLRRAIRLSGAVQIGSAALAVAISQFVLRSRRRTA